MIVMTDGRSQDNVRGPSNLLRKRGVRIFCLGIGKRYNMRQLLQMAGSRRNVFTADFRNLGSVVRAIKQKACKGKKGEKDFRLVVQVVFRIVGHKWHHVVIEIRKSSFKKV